MGVTPEETCAASASPGRLHGYGACFFFHKPGALLPCKTSEADGLLSLLSLLQISPSKRCLMGYFP